MNSHSLRPTIESLESRDGPVILIVVLPLLNLYKVEPISFATHADDHASPDVRIDSRGCSVSIASDSCRDCVK